MDPEQRFLATCRATLAAATAEAAAELLARAGRLEAAGRLHVAFSGDAEGEYLGFELPGPRQRARVLTVWSRGGRARLDLTAAWLPQTARVALLLALAPAPDGAVVLDARLPAALEALAEALAPAQ